MSKLNKIVPDGHSMVKRSTLLTVADMIAWLQANKPDALKAAIQAGGQKEVRAALNDLESSVELWR